jgi:L-2-hydroxyglutarate oxidase
MVRGGVHAGPNAVLALRREGYTWRDVDLGELATRCRGPASGGSGQARGAGRREVVRSLSRTAFARSLARLVPGIEARDLTPAPAGVRAQALRRDGSLVDDFLVQTGPRQVHVLNAPSPAATASLEIADHLVAQVDAVSAEPSHRRRDGQNSVSEPRIERWRCWLQTDWAVLVFAPVMQSSYCFCGT